MHSINSTCRACLQSAVYGVSLFDMTESNGLKFCEMLSSCAGFNISEKDDHPKVICKSCAFELPSAWKFIEMCKTSNEYLQKHFKENKFSNISDILDVKLEIKEEFDPSVECDSSSDREDRSFLPEVRESQEARPLRKNKKIRKKKSSKKTEWKCVSCFYIAATECGLKKHIRRNHPELGEETFPCSFCSKTFKRKSDRVVHTRSHSGERPFACAHCPQRFSQSGTLILHTRRHTGETPFRCAACPRLFSCHSSLRRHARTHSGERPFACERCGATFAQPGCLRQHAAVHSEERPYACATCGRSLKSRMALRNHLLTHGDKSFVCECCGKKFFVKANLDKHCKKMHRSEAGVCAVCAKPCSDLTRHMLLHSDLCSFRCQLCPRAFRTPGNLSFHITTRHDNERKYKCDMDKCSQAFPKQSMLDFHTRKVHSNETPYTCKLCSNGFFRKSDLSRHLNTVHPNDRIPLAV